jgi:hypothetical protein
LSLKTNVDCLSVVWPQNYWDGFSSVWASKPIVTVCEWFGIKTTQTVVSGGLALKPTATVSPGLASKSVVGFLVEPQNQGGGGFPGLNLKTGSSVWDTR